MLRAYQRAGHLRTDVDPLRLRTRIKAWLLRIASRLALGRGKTLVPTDLFDGIEDFPSSTGDPAAHPPPPPSDELEVMQEALEALSPKEQDVIRTHLTYCKPGVTHQRLPNSVSSALAARCGTTAAGVRMTYMRAKAKLEKTYMEALKRRRDSGGSS